MDTGITTETIKPQAKRTKKNIVIISLLVFILLMLAVTAQIVYAVLKNDSIYNGINVDNFSAGGLTKDELQDLLEKNYGSRSEEQRITLNTEKLSQDFTFSDISVSYNISETIDKVFSIGRNGNIFHRLKEIYKVGKEGKTIELEHSFDNDKLQSIVQSLFDKTFIPVKEAELLINEDRVILRSGHHGESIDKTFIISEIEKLISSKKGGAIEIPTITTKPDNINVDDFFNQINCDPVNASATVENNKVKILSHINGRKIDKASLASISAELDGTENTEKLLPVVFKSPEITRDKAKTMIFRDVLATASSHFSTSTVNNRNRGENIKLASSKINGKLIAPGEVFSFNETVGKRSAESGYKTAHVYSAGKVIDDVGGGICQVSSTLYNAVLHSDLNIVERRNHSFTVGYVPLGMDATVSYGSVDFKFKNSTKWPIKVQATVDKSNNVIFKLIGTNEAQDIKLEYIAETVKTTKYTKKIIDDPSLPEGKTIIKQKGKNGYVINTYKIVKQGGKEISRKKLNTSVYRPLQEEIIKGTKKVPVSTVPEPTSKPAPDDSSNIKPEEDPSEGVDDADNPPADGV